ncbi:MAG: staygreen family protein [Clostridiales bacterium]|nr:staygreen family protein [Clostridiales bacterium]MCF8021795.1 staygreen family protein [Clostridiales bacterium]
MIRLNPDKLNTEYINVTPEKPVINRKYTLTHSDITAELFLTIGLTYAYEKITPLRDEVLAEWLYSNCKYYLRGYVYVGEFGFEKSKKRYSIFKRELPLTLAAIRSGDKKFFSVHPHLDKCSIYIYFASLYPELQGYQYYGTPSNFKKYYR